MPVQGTEWLRFCGALGMILSCFSGLLPFSLRLAFFVAVLFLGLGNESFSDALLRGEFGGLSVQTLVRECSIGVFFSLPACICCWALILFSNWVVQWVSPNRTLWVSRFGRTKDPDYSRVKTFVSSLVLLGSIGFLPVFTQFLLALTETSRHSMVLGTAEHFFSAQSVFASLRIAWTAAFGLALPILSLSLAFDCGVVVLARYLRSFAQDPALQGVKILLLCSAIFASLYSLSEMAPSLGSSATSPVKLQSLASEQGKLP